MFISVFSLLASFALFLSHGLCAIVKVNDWAKGPTAVNMYLHVPPKVQPNAPVIVMIHFCGGSAQAYYRSTTAYERVADKNGYILIYPDTALDSHCWDVARNKALRHEGGGDNNSIANMVRYVLKKYNADPKRVYATGTSSGGMMTNVLMATYPDMFAAGAVFSGFPHGCAATGKDGSKPSSSPMSDKTGCNAGRVIKTPARWGDMVRSAYPGYNGTRPNVQLWHGTTDTVVRIVTMTEELKQWSNVLGVQFTRNVTNDPQQGYTKAVYGDGTKLVGYIAKGVGHVVPQHPTQVLKFFGLKE